MTKHGGRGTPFTHSINAIAHNFACNIGNRGITYKSGWSHWIHQLRFTLHQSPCQWFCTWLASVSGKGFLGIIGHDPSVSNTNLVTCWHLSIWFDFFFSSLYLIKACCINKFLESHRRWFEPVMFLKLNRLVHLCLVFGSPHSMTSTPSSPLAHVATLLDWIPIFEWYVLVITKNGHGHYMC